MAPLPGVEKLEQFAVRVSQVTGSRTCRMVVASETRAGAEETALAEVGEGWAVLEVTPI